MCELLECQLKKLPKKSAKNAPKVQNVYLIASLQRGHVGAARLSVQPRLGQVVAGDIVHS